MIAILAEGISDAEVLANLVRRRAENNRLQIRKKSYDGCAELCNKGARDIKLFAQLGVKHVIVCHDADRSDPRVVYQTVHDRVIRPSGFTGPACITIPVEEIESWIIADEQAINEVIPSFRFEGHSSPESIPDPKEWLRRKSRAANGKPLYSPKTFNPSVALKLRFDVVSRKCPSFRSFLDWLDSAFIPA